MSMPEAGWSLAIAVVLLGLLFFWRLSWYGEDKIERSLLEKIRADLRRAFDLRSVPREGYRLDSFATFFLGGKKVGGELTGQTNWSLCFAFANAIWYFAFLGYTHGPWTFLLQLPWTLSIVVLSRLLLIYIAASAKGTVHGFLGHTYGAPTAILAAVATCLGYIINCGFEIFYSIHLLAVAFDFKSLEFLASVGTAFFITGCIVAGGYTANVRTDLWKNAFGIVALVLLLAYLTPAYLAKFPSTYEALTTPWVDQKYNSLPPWHFIVGITVFAFFFNFVDMANWQSLAANQDLSAEEKKRVKTELIWSALKQLLAPALLGVCLGVFLKALQADIKDEEYFKVAFGIAFPAMSLFGGLVLGLILLGFLSATISSVDNYLLAATQTIAVDIVARQSAEQLRSGSVSAEDQKQKERLILDWCKRGMPVLAVVMILTFSILYYSVPERVFTYQFVMYGAAVTIFPVVVGALVASRSTKSAPALDREPPVSNTNAEYRAHSEGPIAPGWAFTSVAVGLIFVLVPFALTSRVQQLIRLTFSQEVSTDAIANLTPLTGLLAASIIFFIGVLFKKYPPRRQHVS